MLQQLLVCTTCPFSFVILSFSFLQFFSPCRRHRHFQPLPRFPQCTYLPTAAMAAVLLFHSEVKTRQNFPCNTGEFFQINYISYFYSTLCTKDHRRLLGLASAGMPSVVLLSFIAPPAANKAHTFLVLYTQLEGNNISNPNELLRLLILL